MPQDLKAVALGNSTSLQARSLAAIGSDSSDTTRRFFAHAQRSVAAHAFGFDKLAVFHEERSVLSKRGVLRKQNPTASTAQIEGIAGMDSKWYTRRTAFEDNWINGRELVYLAVILQGTGAAEFGFGDFVLVMDLAHAVFPQNTAEYATVVGSLSPACNAEAASWSDRSHLLVIKHAAAIPTILSRSVMLVRRSLAVHEVAIFSRLVCNSERELTEAVHFGPIDLSCFKEIRISRQLHDRLCLAATSAVAGLPLTAEGKRDAEAFSILKTWHADYRLSIVVV